MSILFKDESRMHLVLGYPPTTTICEYANGTESHLQKPDTIEVPRVSLASTYSSRILQSWDQTHFSILGARQDSTLTLHLSMPDALLNIGLCHQCTYPVQGAQVVHTGTTLNTGNTLGLASETRSLPTP